MSELLALSSELNWNFILSAVAIGAVISTLINLTGVGGGVVVIPVLSIVFSLPPVAVIGTASLYVTFSKFFSTLSHVKSGTVEWRSSFWFLLGAAPAVLLTTVAIIYFLEKYPEHNAALQKAVYYLTVSMMILACATMLKNGKTSAATKNKLSMLAGSGFFIGVVMGSTGIGGGVLIIPALSLFGALSVKQVVSGSLFIALVLSGLTGLVYSEGGQYDPSVLVGLLMGSLVGVYASNLFRHKISDKHLRKAIIALIFAAAIAMLFRQAPV